MIWPTPEMLETKPDTVFQPVTPRFLALTQKSLGLQKNGNIQRIIQR